MTRASKGLSLFIVLLAYVAAFFAGLLVFRLLPFSDIMRYLCADAAATVIVFAFGLVLKNASLYDPYWSVAPPVLYLCFLLDKGFADAADFVMLGVLLVWGIRLTLNWIIGWRGLDHQDWRYTMLKEKNPKIWFLTNFFGINMMPTLIVFANMAPAYLSATASKSIGILTVLGAAVCLLAILLQIISDSQMRRFRLSQQGGHIASGLWKYSRHPNYLGEVMLWWGVYIMMLGAAPQYWWAVVAPVLMTLLFVFISIPMMEKRLLATKQGYKNYQKATSILLLWPPKQA